MMRALQQAAAADHARAAPASPTITVQPTTSRVTGRRVVALQTMGHTFMDNKGRVRIDVANDAGVFVGEPSAAVVNLERNAPDAHRTFAALGEAVSRGDMAPGQAFALVAYEGDVRAGKGSLGNRIVGITALVAGNPDMFVPTLALWGTWFGCWRDMRSLYEHWHGTDDDVSRRAADMVVACFAADLGGAAPTGPAFDLYRHMVAAGHVTRPWPAVAAVGAARDTDRDTDHETKRGDGGGGPRLSAKWLPVQKHTKHGGKKNGRHHPLFTAVASHMFPGETVAAAHKRLRVHLKPLRVFVEQPFMAGKRDSIVLGTVPSRALQKMRRSFTNVDRKGKPKSADPGRVALAARVLDFVTKTPGDVKGDALEGIDIIKTLFGVRGKKSRARNGTWSLAPQFDKAPDPFLEAQWGAWVRAQNADAVTNSMIVVLDFSGSMNCPTADGAIFIALLVGAAVCSRDNGAPFVVAFGQSAHVVPMRFDSEAKMRRHLAGNANIPPRYHAMMIKHPTSLWTLCRLMCGTGGHRVEYGATNFDAVVTLACRAVCGAGVELNTLVAVSDMKMDHPSALGVETTAQSITEQSRATWDRCAAENGCDDVVGGLPLIVYWNASPASGKHKMVALPDTPGVVQLNGGIPRMLDLVVTGKIADAAANASSDADSTMLADEVYALPLIAPIATATWAPVFAE